MWPPPLLSSRAPTQQVLWALLGPIVAGSICGVLLGVSATAYAVAFSVMILAGVGTGFEHLTAGEAAVRGVASGLLFGTFILFAHTVSGLPTKATLPDPHVLLVVATTIIGSSLGAIGGCPRRRYAERVAAREPLT